MHNQDPDRRSDELQFQQYFASYSSQLRNFLYYKCGDMQQAEDLMQEAFIRLWHKREDVPEPKVKSFLFTVANNLFLDHVKHQQVVLKFQKRPQKQINYEHPHFLMEEEEFQQHLENAINCLPEKSRIVFLMNRIDKLSYKEIATRLSISVKAVEKRMHKALVELKKINPGI